MTERNSRGEPAGSDPGEGGERGLGGSVETARRWSHRAAEDRAGAAEAADAEATRSVEAVEPAEAPGLAGFESAEAARLRLKHARELELAGEVPAALEVYRDLALEDPGALAPRLALGAIYQRQGQHALALEQYEAGREIAPDNVDLLLAMVAALMELKHYDQAEAVLRRALRLEPGRAAVHAAIGTLDYKRGLYVPAEQELKRALDLDPGQAAAYFYRGECLNQLGRVDEALEMLEHAVQFQPTNSRAFFTMGILYDRKHLPQQAAAMYRKAREVSPA